MPLIRKNLGPAQTALRPARDPFAALASGAPDDRWTAARSIGTEPGGVAALQSALAGETDDRVREAIFMGLARAATPESVEAVALYLRGEDAKLRSGALDALCAMALAAAPILPRLLADRDADVRLLSCEIVRALPPEQASPMLCALLECEVVVNVCAAAVEVLAEVGGPDAGVALTRCAERFAGEAFLQFAIKAAGERIGAQPGRHGV